MEFEWDRTKAEQNLRKHGVAFEDAVDLFDDPRHLTQEGKIVDGEVRFKTTGLTIIHVLRETTDGSVMRIISARPASRRERRSYER